MDPNLRALLGQQAGTVERPPAYPQGTYDVMIAKHAFDKSSEKKTDFVRFETYVQRCVQLDDPTQQARLDKIDKTKRALNDDFYITPDALYRLTEFLTKTLGFDASKPVDELIPLARGQMYRVYVIEEPSKKPGDDAVYNRIATRGKVA